MMPPALPDATIKRMQFLSEHGVPHGRVRSWEADWRLCEAKSFGWVGRREESARLGPRTAFQCPGSFQTSLLDDDAEHVNWALPWSAGCGETAIFSWLLLAFPLLNSPHPPSWVEEKVQSKSKSDYSTNVHQRAMAETGSQRQSYRQQKAFQMFPNLLLTCRISRTTCTHL